MLIKKIVKGILIGLSSAIDDLLYRRPYFDKETKIRRTATNELLHLDLVVTECCSLKCRDCSNLMQYYKKPENLSVNEIIKDLKRLLECVRVRELKLLGGEPFINQEALIEIMRLIASEYGDRVDTINIITNGTIIPRKECIDAMRDNPKTMVTFSNYSTLSSKRDELSLILQENSIRYIYDDDSFCWIDFGRPIKYRHSEQFLNRQYKNCYNRKFCNTLYRGKVYICPRQAHGIRLGLLPDINSEYVDMYDDQYGSTDDLRKALIKLVRKTTPPSACQYCIEGKHVLVPRAVQLNGSNTIKD